MIIFLKNKHTLQVDDFFFKCVVGKKGLSKEKVEGDKKTPKGYFNLGHLFYRKDRNTKIFTKLKKTKILKSMGWCDDVQKKKYYNKLIKVNKKIKHEKLFRKDYKYDLLIPIEYNYKNSIQGLGSCIFIHLINRYKPTAGCIALKKNDFLIMLKILNKKNNIKIS
tara:strand:- start:1184 stop:1678 length:495 start_codon:yes stop_codon:yes gene_type:complete